MGRTQKSSKGVYHDRIIDIDILMYGNKKIHSARLTIPHPRMYERDFVMQPLRKITNYVRDAVLEAGRDEEPYGKEYRQNPSGDILSSIFCG